MLTSVVLHRLAVTIQNCHYDKRRAGRERKKERSELSMFTFAVASLAQRLRAGVTENRKVWQNIRNFACYKLFIKTLANVEFYLSVEVSTFS